MVPTLAIITIGGDPIQTLAGQWRLIALRGLSGSTFGVLAIIWPEPTLASLMLVFAAYMLADGALAVISALLAAQHGEKWAVAAAEGSLSIVAGTVVVAVPSLSVLGAVYVAAFWALLSGMALLIVRARFGWGSSLMAAAAVASILLGPLLLFSSAAGVLVLAIWLGVYALVFGGALLGLAWQLRDFSHHHAF